MYRRSFMRPRFASKKKKKKKTVSEMKTTTRQIANIAIDEQASIVRIFFSLFFFYNKPVTACIVAYLSNLFDYYFFFS